MIDFNHFKVLQSQMKELANIIERQIGFKFVVYPNDMEGGTCDALYLSLSENEVHYFQDIVKLVKWLERYIQFCKRPESNMMESQIINKTEQEIKDAIKHVMDKYAGAIDNLKDK